MEFEEYQRHNVWGEPGGLAHRSGAGDLDVVVYSAGNWCRLALAADRFLGYLRSQRAAMTGQVGAHTNRPEVVASHGYDPKFAMHPLREAADLPEQPDRAWVDGWPHRSHPASWAG